MSRHLASTTAWSHATSPAAAAAPVCDQRCFSASPVRSTAIVSRSDVRVSPANQAAADRAPLSIATSSATANTPARHACTRPSTRVRPTSSSRFCVVVR